MASCLSLVKLPSPTVAVSKASIIAPLMVSRDGPATMLNLAMNLSEFAININSTGSGPQMSHLNATVCRVADVAVRRRHVPPLWRWRYFNLPKVVAYVAGKQIQELYYSTT
jgi:hypothetical protein